MKNKIKFCIVCGRRIPENSSRRKICSEDCKIKRKYLVRYGQTAPYENATEPPITSQTLGELNAEARKVGLSYGRYMALKTNDGN